MGLDNTGNLVGLVGLHVMGRDVAHSQAEASGVKHRGKPQRQASTGTGTQAPHPSGVRLSLHHQVRLRSAPPGALPAPPRAPLLPPARSARAAPTRAHMQAPVCVSRSPQSASGSRRCLRRGIGRHRDGGGTIADCGPVGVRAGAPIPSTADPGRAEQTRPRGVKVVRTVARSTFDAPEPRPLHGVWVDGGRDGSWGEWWVPGEQPSTTSGAGNSVTPPEVEVLAW